MTKLGARPSTAATGRVAGRRAPSRRPQAGDGRRRQARLLTAHPRGLLIPIVRRQSGGADPQTRAYLGVASAQSGTTAGAARRPGRRSGSRLRPLSRAGDRARFRPRRSRLPLPDARGAGRAGRRCLSRAAAHRSFARAARRRGDRPHPTARSAAPVRSRSGGTRNGYDRRRPSPARICRPLSRLPAPRGLVPAGPGDRKESAPRIGGSSLRTPPILAARATAPPPAALRPAPIRRKARESTAS